MTTTRTSASRRSMRGAAVAFVAGAGIALTPLPASANAGGAAAPAPAAAPVAAAPVAASAPAAAPSSAAQVAVDTALAQQGKPYAWGGNGPGSFDCSGLTSFAYRAAGVELPRTSRAQSTVGVPVAKSDLQPGDLIFYYNPVGHVGIYIGNGQMVHAPTSGQVVHVTGVDSMYGYNTARRVV